MFSDVIKSTLEKEVVGQPRAVASVVRGVTRAVSGLVPREGTQCAYMFMGPTGTGKTRLVHSLARAIHGDEQRLVVADCTHFSHGDPWNAFVSQLLPLFQMPPTANKWSLMETPTLSIILVEYLERGRKEVSKALSAALETGQVMLPEGRRGSLRNCMVFITSSLGSREILSESPRIGFSAADDEDTSGERGKIFQACLDQAEEHFGTDLMGRLDDMVIFHRLQEGHLSAILERLMAHINHWLALRGFRCELLPAAEAFLLERGQRDLRTGARNLVRAHRRFVEFPVADMLVSGRIPSAGVVCVDREPDRDHLHFTVTQPENEAGAPTLGQQGVTEIPVSWEEAPILR